MNRFSVALGTFALGAAHLLGGGRPGLAQLEPPNVVLVVVDDLGWADLSCQGSTF